MQSSKTRMIEINKVCVPPEWALLQRRIMDTLNEAALEFVHIYTRPDGTLIWREEWPGMDGSDDPYEGFMHFPLFYALGGKEELHNVSRRLWDAITWQWTEYGQIHREFDAYYDWMHHGEALHYIFYYGLADPTVVKDRQRSIKFASMYMGDDPEAPNYDKEKRLIRSPINGSRGPRHFQTAEDWCTHREVLDNYPPPFEDIPGVTGPKCNWSDDHIYEQILLRINERMARGDVPLNLTSTSLMTHVFMYTGEDKYRLWVQQYFEAWEDRTDRNDGITPDNVGLSGEIGEYNDGKWWGGYYGWRWPHGSKSIIEPLIVAGCNLTLMHGDTRYLDLGRSQIDMLWGLRQEIKGEWKVPNKYLDSGWSNYQRMNPWYALYCWVISMEDQDLERIERIRVEEDWSKPKMQTGKGFLGNHGSWFQFIRGLNPQYPEQILRINYELICKQIETMRSDQGDPASWNIHHWQQRTPMILEGLIQTMLGAPMHIYHGGLLHARVRYYDGNAKRPGLPEGVAVLVKHLDASSVTIELYNLETEEKHVVIQAGTFGEHMFHEASLLGADGEVQETVQVEDKWAHVRMSPGSGGTIRLTMSRYVNKPSYNTPWITSELYSCYFKGRTV
jgi:hypothetical protein